MYGQTAFDTNILWSPVIIRYSDTAISGNYAVQHKSPPWPRNRREKRIEASLGDRLNWWVTFATGLWGPPDYNARWGDHLWNAKFWEMITTTYPRHPRSAIPSRPRPGHKPTGQRSRIRTCSSSWTATRS